MTVIGDTLFCDDIRNEVGGKKSFIGVYSQTLEIEKFPILLPKFGFAVTIVFDAEKEIPDNFVLRVYLPGDADGKPSISAEMLSETQQAPPVQKLPEDARAMKDTPPKIAMRIDFLVSPLQLKQAGPMKVDAVLNDEVIPVGRLAIVHRPPNTTPTE